MYERFTDRARKVLQLANQEAQRFNHDYIGTRHILLGLIKEGSGVAANVLKTLRSIPARSAPRLRRSLSPDLMSSRSEGYPRRRGPRKRLNTPSKKRAE